MTKYAEHMYSFKDDSWIALKALFRQAEQA